MSSDKMPILPLLMETKQYPYSWDDMRDICEASALFFNEAMNRGENMSTLGYGDSRNAPDVMASVGIGWRDAVHCEEHNMDGEYIEALDKYIEYIFNNKIKDIFFFTVDQFTQIGVSAIRDVILEWNDLWSKHKESEDEK